VAGSFSADGFIGAPVDAGALKYNTRQPGEGQQMTLKEFAEAKKLHTITVQRYIRDGMPAEKKFIGSGRQWKWEIDPDAADKWIAKQRKGVSGEHG
jgi:phage terminase Nu1 subunit (DNA packaging protein)